LTLAIGILLLILVISIALFSIEWIPPDVVAIGILLALILTGLLPADKAFGGFGSDTVIMILGLLILSAALQKTGVVDIVGNAILKHSGKNPRTLFVAVVISSSVLSAFISNTAATAFFLPMVIGIAARAKTSSSRLLLPLAFASILSSSVMLVSTSTNLVVSGLMTQHGLEQIGMFELATVGIPIAVAGVIYLLTVGQRLIPARGADGEEIDRFGLREYLSEVLVRPGSPLIGKRLVESGLGEDLDLTVLAVIRQGEYVGYRPSLKLREADVLLVEGQRESILKVRDQAGIDIRPEVEFAEPALQAEDSRLVEVILMPGSTLIGRTLKTHRFRERHGLQVLAINRHGSVIRSKLSELRLRLGDVLLVQGHRTGIAALEEERVSRVLGVVTEARQNRARAPIAIAAFAGALALATAKILPFPVAVLLGALVVFVSKCITPQEAYREVEWKVIILIGCMLALGVAMQETGTAAWVAGKIVSVTSTLDPRILLGGFFVLTVVLTQPMSNQAAAVVLVPIAIQTAVALGLNPRTFAVMVAVAASCSYMTPLEPSCLMVYGPGRYKFVDFLRVGGILALIILAIAIVIVPMAWPLRPAS
jgi:di/tricarboxylate transporter